MGPPSVLGLKYLEVRDLIDELAAGSCAVLAHDATITDRWDLGTAEETM